MRKLKVKSAIIDLDEIKTVNTRSQNTKGHYIVINYHNSKEPVEIYFETKEDANEAFEKINDELDLIEKERKERIEKSKERLRNRGGSWMSS